MYIYIYHDYIYICIYIYKYICIYIYLYVIIIICIIICTVGTVHQVLCSWRRLLRRGLEFHVCTINKSAHMKKVWKLI